MIFQNDFNTLLSIIVFTIASFITIYSGIKQDGIISWSVGIPLFYLFFFIVAPLLQYILIKDYTFNNKDISTSFYIASVGVFSFLLGKFISSKLLRNIKFRTLGSFKIFNLFHLYSVNIIFFFIGLIFTIYAFNYGYFGLLNSDRASSNSFIGVLSSLTLYIDLVNIISWFYYFHNKENKWLILAILSTVFLIMVGLVSNSKTEILKPLLIIFINYYLVIGKINYKYLLFIIIGFLLFAFPFITNLRYKLYITTISSRINYAEFVFNYLVNGDWLKNFGDINSSINAVGRDLLNVFNIITETTGKSTSFLNGETYSDALSMMIPRFLWNNKPDINIGNFIGYKYHLISSTDIITNIAPTQMGELFMNFGTFGVALGMFIWGILAFLVDKIIIGTYKINWLSIWFFSLIIWQGSVIGQTLIPFMKTFFLLIIILMILNTIMKFFRKIGHNSLL
jgi:hypothetical protein